LQDVRLHPNHRSVDARLTALCEVEYMASEPLLDKILGLPPEERFELLADVGDSIAAEPEAVPVPEWHREERTAVRATS